MVEWKYIWSIKGSLGLGIWSRVNHCHTYGGIWNKHTSYYKFLQDYIPLNEELNIK